MSVIVGAKYVYYNTHLEGVIATITCVKDGKIRATLSHPTMKLSVFYLNDNVEYVIAFNEESFNCMCKLLPPEQGDRNV